MSSLAKGSVVEALSKEQSAPLGLMTRPPADPTTREGIGAQVWTGILMRFEASLSERDRGLWRNPPADVSVSPEHLRVLNGFDDFLLSQFAEWGWRLLMSSAVLQRLAEWEKHNPRMLRRLGEELELRSLVFRGEKPAPLPNDIDQFADSAIPELERLLRLQRDHYGVRAEASSCSDVAAWMRETIRSRPVEFPSLSANVAQLCGWVETLPGRNADAGRRVRCGTMTARALFPLWYSETAGRSLKDVRNQISRRRNARR